MADTVSVVIVTYNRPQKLQQTLAALARQTRYPDEVVVVNNGSTQDYDWVMQQFSTAFTLVYTRTARMTIPAGRNAGIQLSSGDYLAFTDDDCIPHPQWLEALIHPLQEEPTVGEVGGRTITVGKRSWIISEYLTVKTRVERADQKSREIIKGTAYPWAYFPTANAAIRRAALDSVGCFDEQCATGEDVDMTVRLQRAGWRLWYAAEAVVDHEHRETVLGLLVQRFFYGFGHPYLFEKHECNATPRNIAILFGKSGRVLFRIPFFQNGLIDIRSAGAYGARTILFLYLAACVFWGIAGVVCLLSSLALIGVYLQYVSREYRIVPAWKGFLFFCMGYLMKGAYILGGFSAGIKRGTLFIE